MVRFCDFKNAVGIEIQRFALLEKLLPVYKELIGELKAARVSEIQIHEPALVFAGGSLNSLFEKAYPEILADGLDVNFVSFMEDVGEKNYQWMTDVKEFTVLSMDFTRGDSLGLIKKFGFPKDKTLGAGVIDGRSVWKINPAFVLPLFEELKSAVDLIRIQPSANLQFNPHHNHCNNHENQATIQKTPSVTMPTTMPVMPTVYQSPTTKQEQMIKINQAVSAS
eukprot:707030_1